MGQTLSEPVTEKHTSMTVRGTKYAVAVSDMQGWRISMEDAHSIHLSLPSGINTAKADRKDPEDPNSEPSAPAQPEGSTMTNIEGQDAPAFFAVFDGHGGSAVANYTGTTIATRLSGLEAYKNGDYDEALKTLYLKTDQDLRADPSFLNDPSGCTAVSALLTLDGRLIVANAGDSRSVLSYQGKAEEMSFDHKPTGDVESKRITDAGGFVECGRVNGNLALSRAIGDFEFKQNFSLEPEKQIVTADPEIRTHKIDGEEEFLVLACDGIWDCLSSQQVVDFVRRAVAQGHSLTQICEDLMVKCLAPDSELGGIGCDNMTVVIVALLGGRTMEEWQEWVTKRVNDKVGYDTPERVADVFGHSNATPMGGPPGIGAGGFRSLQQVLGSSGVTLHAADDEEMSEGSDDGSDARGGSNGPPISQQEALAHFLRAVTARPPVQSSSPDKIVDGDGDVYMGQKRGETPPPPSISDADKAKESKPQEQLKSQPQGDEASDAVKVEGLMDGSEDPSKM